MARIISRVTDLEGMTEGDVVLVNDMPEQIFWSRLSRDSLPYAFGGFAALSRAESERKKGIMERRYGFDVYGFLIPKPQEELFFEAGNPRYEQLYNEALRKKGI